MLSVLFAIEACYTIQEDNNKEKSFCPGKLPFCQHKLPFCMHKLKKAYFASAFSPRGKKSEL